MSEQFDEIKAEEKAKLDAAEGADVAAEATGRAGRRARRRERRRDEGWIFGAVLIVLGLFFLLGNLLPFSFLSNWWALFILIPAIFNFGQAWRQYQEDGRFSGRARGSLVGGLLIGTVAFIFLFNLDWGRIWPVFIIIIGISALLGARGN